MFVFIVNIFYVSWFDVAVVKHANAFASELLMGSIFVAQPNPNKWGYYEPNPGYLPYPIQTNPMKGNWLQNTSFCQIVTYYTCGITSI